MHSETDCIKKRVFVHFYVASTVFIVRCVCQVPRHIQLWFLSFLLQQLKVKFGNNLNKSKFYSGRNYIRELSQVTSVFLLETRELSQITFVFLLKKPAT
jgi:hypothetical protein